METRITQCPRCGTSFRVTDALLAVAAGAVRCGSCLHIFNAREHWLDDHKPEASAPLADTRSSDTRSPATQSPTATGSDRLEPTFDDDDALFDDNTPLFGDEPHDEPASGRSIFNPVDPDMLAADSGDGSGFEGDFLDTADWLTPNSISFAQTDQKADGEDEADESWVESLLHDEPREAAEADAELNDLSDLSGDDFLDPDQHARSAETHNGDDIDNARRSSSAAEPERLSIISDFQFAQFDTGEGAADTGAAITEDIILDLPTAFDPGLRDAPDTAPEAQNPTDAGESLADGDRFDGFSAGERIGNESVPPALRGLSAPPIRMHQFVKEKSWPKLVWGFALIVVVALLPAQYLYFNFNNLARGELRPWLAQACGLIGCQLPPQSDPDRIRTGSLIVRSHPTASGALAVDAIITNMAPFAQPYPELVLQFTDIDGKPVAGRRFGPNEYLGGELTGSRLMPIGQPIHIGLEVRDPGPKAVNYLLAVSPAQE